MFLKEHFISKFLPIFRASMNTFLLNFLFSLISYQNAEKKLEKLDDEGHETKRPILNLDPSSYLNDTNWLWDALMMPQLEFIKHAGLDALVFLRLFKLG